MKLLMHSLLLSLRDSVADPGFDVEMSVPGLPEFDGTNTQLCDLKMHCKVVALSNCCSATTP